MAEKYQRCAKKSTKKFELLGRREVAVPLPLPLVKVWEELQPEVEHLTGLAVLRPSISAPRFWLAARLNSTRLKKRVAKNAVCFCSTVQISYALVEVIFAHDPRFKRGRPDTHDHRGKSLPYESFD
jgi:hypothetical protein